MAEAVAPAAEAEAPPTPPGYKTFFQPIIQPGTVVMMPDTAAKQKEMIDLMTVEMVAFLNSPECGAVAGITMEYRKPGNAVGAIVHGPAAEGKANAVPASTGWSSNVFSAKFNGLVNKSNTKQAVTDAVAAAVAAPIAADAAFAAMVCGEHLNCEVVLFSPGTGAAGPRTDSGTLKAEVVEAGYTGFHSAQNFKNSAKTAGAAALQMLAGKSVVDVAFSQSFRTTFGALFYREGGADAAAGFTSLSTIYLNELGFNSTQRFKNSMDAWCRAHNQLGSQGATLTSFQGMTYIKKRSDKSDIERSGSSGLVFHGIAGAPEEIIEQVASAGGCCTIL